MRRQNNSQNNNFSSCHAADLHKLNAKIKLLLRVHISYVTASQPSPRARSLGTSNMSHPLCILSWAPRLSIAAGRAAVLTDGTRRHGGKRCGMRRNWGTTQNGRRRRGGGVVRRQPRRWIIARQPPLIFVTARHCRLLCLDYNTSSGAMGFLYKALAAGSCSVCLASAFVASPPPPAVAAAVRGCSHRRDSSIRRVRPRHSGSSSSSSRAEARLPPLLLSSRTVDVDVIDVTDVTEEEARREKEQVRHTVMTSTHLPAAVG